MREYWGSIEPPHQSLSVRSIAAMSWAILCALLLSTGVYAAQSKGMTSQPALFKMNLEQIDMTGNEKLGLLGTSYLLEANPRWFLGGSVYSAVSGKRGGFFTIGPEVAWRQRISNNWLVDWGLYVGGGGGGGANQQVGGGLMLRQHMDILYGSGQNLVGLSASSVRFPTGLISSDQFGVVFSHTGDFWHVPHDGSASQGKLGQYGGLGFDRTRAVATMYRGWLLEKNAESKSAGMAGMRAEQMISPTSYWGLELLGAVSGGIGGYGEYLGTLGMEAPVWNDRFRVGGRVALGMAGGGTTPMGGGVLAKAGINLSTRLGRDFSSSIESGYVVAPDGQMKAGYASVEIAADIDHPYATSTEFNIDNYEWQVGVVHYQRAVPAGKLFSVPFDAVAMGVNRYLNDNAYYGMQVQFAAQGEVTGGYGAALAGLGMHTPEIFHGLVFGGELSIGGAGGSGLSTGGGGVYKADVFADYKFNNDLALRLGAGRIQAFKGGLNTEIAEMTLRYSYALERRR